MDQGSNFYKYTGATGTTTKLTGYKSGSAFFGVAAVAYPGTGSRIAYTVKDGDYPSEEQVRLYDTATGSDLLLDTYQGDCAGQCLQAVHMTRDGIVFYAASDKNFPFYTVKADGSDRTDMNVYQAFVAPSGQRIITDSKKVVFTSAAPYGPTLAPAATDVYVMNLDGTNIQQVTRFTAPQVASGAVISADGTRIAFTLSEGFTFMPDGTFIPPSKPSEVWTVRTDGTDLRRLSGYGSNATAPSISADGSTVTYIQDSQVWKISTRIDILALVIPTRVISLRLSYASAQTISGDGQQTAVALNNSAIYLAPSGDFTVQWVGLASLKRVYTPRVLFSWGIRSPGETAGPSVGSLITAFGANLGAEELTIAPQSPLPTDLDGIQLLLNGEPLPLHATTPWQINAQIPQGVAPGEVSFVARGGPGNTTSEVRVTVAARDPEVNHMPNTSRRQAAAVYPGTSILADKEHPASPGQILEVYVFGLGVTTPRVAAGAASPANPPATADVQPRISIGDREADVLFAGLVPGLSGVYQVNLRVPNGMRPDPQNPGFQVIRWIDSGTTQQGVAGIYVQE